MRRGQKSWDTNNRINCIEYLSVTQSHAHAERRVAEQILFFSSLFSVMESFVIFFLLFSATWKMNVERLHCEYAVECRRSESSLNTRFYFTVFGQASFPLLLLLIQLAIFPFPSIFFDCDGAHKCWVTSMYFTQIKIIIIIILVSHRIFPFRPEWRRNCRLNNRVRMFFSPFEGFAGRCTYV